MAFPPKTWPASFGGSGRSFFRDDQMNSESMSWDDAFSVLDNLICHFFIDMQQRGNMNMTPAQWIEELTAWLPTGEEFASMQAETL